MRIKQLEWSEIQTLMGRKISARAIGLEWRLDPHNGRASDTARLEREKAKAQDEFERALKRFIEDPDLFTSPKADENNSADNFYLCVLEKIFGKDSDETWRDILAGRIFPPRPREEILEGMDLVAKAEVTKLEMQLRARTFAPVRDAQPAPLSVILNADDKGNVTVVTPTAKDRVVDRLIQEHEQLSADHRTAADKGYVGLTQQLRERLKSIETALAIAVKEGEAVSDKSKEG